MKIKYRILQTRVNTIFSHDKRLSALCTRFSTHAPAFGLSLHTLPSFVRLVISCDGTSLACYEYLSAFWCVFICLALIDGDPAAHHASTGMSRRSLPPCVHIHSSS